MPNTFYRLSPAALLSLSVAVRALASILAAAKILTTEAHGQTFTTIYNFSAGSCCPGTNTDGMDQKGLLISENAIFGWAWEGGSAGGGTVFAINTDGTGFTTLHSFANATATAPPTNDGGARPNGLLSAGDRLYGTAILGGRLGNGTVFSVKTDATGFSTLHDFAGVDCLNCPNAKSDGAGPVGNLVLSNNTLYGTTSSGSTSGNGTVFTLDTNGSAYSTLYGFTPASPCCPLINDDGAAPDGLVLSSNTLYGTTALGGISGNGTVFTVNSDGTGFVSIYSFSANAGSGSPNSDGADPTGSLIASAGTLYGTSGAGGGSGKGTTFAINTDGSGFTVLHIFTGGSDGAVPEALALSGHTLYGTTRVGGAFGSGSIYAINVDGTGFTNLYTFSAVQTIALGVYTNSDGFLPTGLFLSGNTLYGTTAYGGISGNGTVFKLTLPLSLPQLAISSAGQNVMLRWPTNALGFVLQSSSDLTSSTNWDDSTDTPAIVLDQYVLTNTLSATARFYRLKK